MMLRVGYDYPILGNENVVFQICYVKKNHSFWSDVTPDCRQNKWKKVMRTIKNIRNGKTYNRTDS